MEKPLFFDVCFFGIGPYQGRGQNIMLGGLSPGHGERWSASL